MNGFGDDFWNILDSLGTVQKLFIKCEKLRHNLGKPSHSDFVRSKYAKESFLMDTFEYLIGYFRAFVKDIRNGN